MDRQTDAPRLFFVYFLLCSSIYYFRGAPKFPKSKSAIRKSAIRKSAIRKSAIQKSALRKSAIHCLLFIEKKAIAYLGISWFLFVRRCSAWNGSRAFSKYLVRCILLVTSADESRRQIVFCPPVQAVGLAVSPCGVTSADERRRQIVFCPPVYAAGLAISPCGAGKAGLVG
jgi:hypothetical protein